MNFFKHVVDGLASTGTIPEVGRYRKINGSDTARIQGDVARVGLDFRTVIERENGKTTKAQSGIKATNTPGHKRLETA